LRFHEHRRKGFIICMLLMMVCVQSFSMHFHFADGDDEQHSHAHTHTLYGMHADHLTTEHEDEASPDILGVLNKHSLSFDFFALAVLVLFPLFLSASHTWMGVHNKRQHRYLLFFRPPLRAPPR